MIYIWNYLTLVNNTRNVPNEIKQFKCKKSIIRKENWPKKLIALLRGNEYVIALCLLEKTV